MKSIGLIGCSRKSNDLLIRRLKGISRRAEIIVRQLNFEEINELLPHKLEQASVLLAPVYKKMVEDSQVGAIVMPNNTLHEALDQLPSSPKLVHAGSELRNHLKKCSTLSVAIAGSQHTSQGTYFPGFVPSTVMVKKIPPSIVTSVDRLRKSYYQGDDITMADKCYAELKSLPVENIVVACTELSLAFEPFDDKFQIDTIRLQAQRCIELIQE